jgi:NAD(P)-dependent dehydrogenase (short-subunit alcohol dehydrogenase family)
VTRLADTRIVITGGANGLGAEYARALWEEGATVAIADVDEGAGATLVDELGERALFVAIDVSDNESVQAGFGELGGRLGGIDVLVNNAGAYPHQAFEDIDADAWDRAMRVNLYSVFFCTKAVLPHMKGNGGGKIVNVATNLVWVMAPHMAHYIAAKAGVVGLTRGSARELGAYGITVNALAPGANMPGEELSTREIERMREIISYQVIKRPQMHHDLTGAVVFLCSPDSDFMTGQVVCIDGGIAVP